MKVADFASLGEDLLSYCNHFHGEFGRSQARETFDAMLFGLLVAQGRKNTWQLTEATGMSGPDSLQRFLSTTRWDHDSMLATYQRFVLEKLGSSGALLFDETGFLKKGSSSVGVQHQYTGTAGRVANCQVGVFAAWLTPNAHVLFDRMLYFPVSWQDDHTRRARAHVPEHVRTVPKAKLAALMLDRALTTGARPQWVGGDCVYGDDTSLRKAVAAHGLDYVFAVSSTAQVWTQWPDVLTAQQRRTPGRSGRPPRLSKVAPDTAARQRVDDLAQRIDPSQWQLLSIGEGTKGPRLFEWASLPVVEACDELPSRWSTLLIRRHPENHDDLSYYLCSSSSALSVSTLAERAGARWPIEQCFEEAKSLCGLDEYEVRSWVGWHRHITMSMMAHGFIAWQRAKWSEQEQKKTNR